MVKDYTKEVTEFFDYGLDTIDFKTNLPKPVIKEYDGIKVVRDDLLDGGTKRRSLHGLCKIKARDR